MTLKKDRIPQGPSVKEAQQLLNEKKEEAWLILTEKYGKNFLYQGTVVTCDPSVIEMLLMERSHTRKRSIIYRFLYKLIPLPYGLLFLDGNLWQKKLQTVMPVFTRPNISQYTGFMHQYLLQMIHDWDTINQFSDLYSKVVEINAGLLMKVGFGLNPDTVFAKELAGILVDYKFDLMDSRTRLDEFGMSPKMIGRLPKFIIAERKRKKKRQQLNKQIQSIINSGILEKNAGLNWISSLQEAGFSVVEIANEVNHLYGAYNALDYTITCAIYELGRNPDLQEQLKKELSISDDLPVGITHQAFGKIPHTIHFMQEVFRFYPVSMGVSRRTGEAIVTPDLDIPAGQEILIALYALHHHPDYWEHPEQFNPGRWVKGMPNSFTYIPFLKGPRHCIGRHLAEVNFINFIRVWLLEGTIQVPDKPIHLAPFMIPRFEESIHCTFQKCK